MKNDKMCPFKMAGGFIYPACEKGACMMWRNYSGDCAIGTIADILADSTVSQSCYQQPSEKENE
jgi:hypothetical protein